MFLPCASRPTDSVQQALPRQRLLRLVLVVLISGAVGFLSYPRSAAASAGWYHFIDPACLSGGGGSATPGINWWEQEPLSRGDAGAELYFDANGYVLVNSNPGYHQNGSSGDVRNYVSSGYSGNYVGRVYYSGSFLPTDSYGESFYCP